MLSWAPDERRPAGRFGFWGPVPLHSTRTRHGSEVSVGGCCLLIPLVSLIGAGAASWVLARAHVSGGPAGVVIRAARVGGPDDVANGAVSGWGHRDPGNPGE
jgi:hypothetical protein